LLRRILRQCVNLFEYKRIALKEGSQNASRII